METTTQAALARWGDFYLISGGAAAALTGLQFVVQTLIDSALTRTPTDPDPEAVIGAFGTPTVVHFALALLLSAIMSTPWSDFLGLHVALVVVGVGALVYSVVVLRRALRQKSYEPVADDWAWHLVFPAIAYLAVTAAGFALGHGAEWALYVIGAATMALLFVGIHNAWDTVTYLTISAFRRDVGAVVTRAEATITETITATTGAEVPGPEATSTDHTPGPR